MVLAGRAGLHLAVNEVGLELHIFNDVLLDGLGVLGEGQRGDSLAQA